MDKITVVLLRVSTDSQKTDSQQASLSAETKRRGLIDVSLDRYNEVKKLGITGQKYAVWIEDKGTGKNTDRKGYQWALSQVKGGWCSAVLVYDISRLNRNLIENLLFARECEQRKVELRGVMDGATPDSKEGRLLFGMMSLFAERERENIVERTKAGIAARKARGLPHGGTSKGWTARRVAKLLPRCYDMIDAGCSNYHIKRILGLNYRTIRKYRLIRSEGTPIVSRKDSNIALYGQSAAVI